MVTSQSNSLVENKAGCIDRAVKILGDKWTPLIIKELRGGCIRFCRLQQNLNNINPRTLSARLQDLELEKIIVKSLPDDSSHYAGYRLTQKGEDLVPILQQMAKWGDKYHC